MKVRNTILLAFLTAGLLAVIFFRESLPFFSRQKLQPGSCVLQFSLDDVRAFEIRRGTDFFRFEKTGGGWLMGPAPKDRASGEEIEKILRAAQSLKIIDCIPGEEFEGKMKSKNFGLASAKTSLRVETKKGQQEIFFGREGSGDDRMFVRTDKGKDTYLVSDTLYRLLLRDADTFRDARLVALGENRIERLLLLRPDGEIEFVRKGTEWEIHRPMQTEADTEKVKKLLELALGAKVLRFVSGGDDPGAGARIGEIQIWEEGENSPVSLKVSTTELPERYAVNNSSRKVGTVVPAANFALLSMPLDELRSRNLIGLNPDTVDRFRVKTGSGEWNFSRKDRGWEVAFAGKKSQAAEEEIAALFSKINGLQVREFLIGSSTGTKPDAPPTAELKFSSWLSENTPEATAGEHPVATLEFFTSETGELVRVNESPGFRVLPPGVVEELQAWLDALSLPSTSPDLPKPESVK